MATKPLVYTQDGFSGGMQSRLDATRIAKNAYALLINGRNRFDTLRPVKKPVNVALPEQGLVQGCYAAGNYLLVFVAGKAWFRNYATGGQWSAITGLQMDPLAPVIYAELVPASSVNRARVAASSNANGTVNLTSVLATSPRCVVVQDGKNQPWIIESTGIGRPAKAYGEWTANDREYVPIGLNMLHHNGKLYIVSRDRTKIYHSVSGRPLDFGVAVDTAGVIAGTADDVSHSVGYTEITCLAPLNSPDGGFYVGTLTSSHMVIPDFDNTIFGEPQFDTRDLFPTGAINQFCFTDAMGDSVFIDFTGVRSFNAVAQTQNEGKNTPFAQDVSNLFEGIVQDTPCVARYDNLILFAVETIYGSGVLVYDELTQGWVGLDIYAGVGTIKQFAEVKTTLGRRLFFITDDNLLYEAFAGTTVETLRVFLGEWCSGSPGVSQSMLAFKAVFTESTDSGNVSITPYVDRKALTAISAPLTATSTVRTPPVALPFGASTTDNCKVAEFNLASGFEQGWKTGFWLEHSLNAELSHVLFEASGAPDEEAKGGRHSSALA